MHGLTVRWSLRGAPDGVEQSLASYVAETSHAQFTAKDGLRFKTWRMRAGERFEGCYVFESSEARDAFQTEFTATAAESPGSQIIGVAPELIEPCEVVAVQVGAAGYRVDQAYACRTPCSRWSRGTSGTARRTSRRAPSWRRR